MQSVFVRTEPATTDTEVTSEWDSEGFTLSCRVSYFTVSTKPPILRDSIDGQLGIAGPVKGLITAHRFALALDDQHRINDFDYFTYPKNWTIASLPPMIVTPAMLFLKAAFDDNGLSDAEPEPEVIYDPAHSRLCLRWGPAQSWYALAPKLALGVSDDDRLMQIRLEEFSIPEQEWRNEMPLP